MTLTMARVFTPAALHLRSASRLSAVSPDWLMMIASVFGTMGLLRYRNSEATSTRTGMPVRSSKTY